MASQRITNGESVPASIDLHDQKGKLMPWPVGTVFADVTGGDAGDADGVAQWVPDAAFQENGKGTVTTVGDNVGTRTFAWTATLPDGTIKTGTSTVEVVHGPPGEGELTFGTPVPE